MNRSDLQLLVKRRKQEGIHTEAVLSEGLEKRKVDLSLKAEGTEVMNLERPLRRLREQDMQLES